MTRVSVDPDLCTGHGRCYTLLVNDVSGELAEHAAIGEQNCPESAITLARRPR